MNKVYIIGSLRNPRVPEIAAWCRAFGFEVFDDWFAAGPEADDYWQKYEKAKGSTYPQALAGFAAQHVFAFDKKHLDACDIAILVMPAGKSGHLEIGWCAGKGKRTAILLDGEPERFDVMYNFVDRVCLTQDELAQWLVPFFMTEAVASTMNPTVSWPYHVVQITPRTEFYEQADTEAQATVTPPVVRSPAVGCMTCVGCATPFSSGNLGKDCTAYQRERG